VFLIAVAVLAVSAQEVGSFTDPRDKKKYNTVTIGNRTWMAQNLDHQTKDSWCYANSGANCTKYGRLYTLDAAKAACPVGWRLPNDGDWDNVLTIADKGWIPGTTRMRFSGGLFENGELGFLALPGGYRHKDGTFVGVGNDGDGYWWFDNGKEDGASGKYFRLRFDNRSRLIRYEDRKFGHSVRCVQDIPDQPSSNTPPPPNSAEDFRVTLTKDNAGVVISGYIGKTKDVHIPSTIQGMPVREIGKAAFKDSPLRSIIFPAGLTEIGIDAFNNSPLLRSITFPEGLTVIGNGAFEGCVSLSFVTFPSTLVSIGDNAFNNCISLLNIALPEGLTTIGNNAFARCKDLKTVTIPSTLVSIGNRAFLSCSELQKITLPEGLATIGTQAFRHCISLTSINIPNSVTRIGDGAFATTSITSITWPASVTSIGSNEANVNDTSTQGMFAGCSYLKTVVIPEGVTAVGPMAFGSTGITNIVLPSTIRSINSYAFGNCKDLTTVTIPETVEKINFGYQLFRHSTRVYAFDNSRKIDLLSQAALKRVGYPGQF